VTFLAASDKLHGLTADRAEFLGRHGSYAAPAAMGRIGLANAVRAGLDPCAALQLHLDLAPGATAHAHFRLGQAAGRAEALGLVAKYRERATVGAAWGDLQAAPRELRGRADAPRRRADRSDDSAAPEGRSYS
jgi:cyclic beta-1,2-glucan synthetase